MMLDVLNDTLTELREAMIEKSFIYAKIILKNGKFPFCKRKHHKRNKPSLEGGLFCRSRLFYDNVLMMS
jgi:hypothetical protein